MIIGFIGAPSCGKTTTALGLCYRLKLEDKPAEFIPEAARQKIVESRIAGTFEKAFERQQKIYAEDTYLHNLYRYNGDNIAITDGSTINCYFYGFDMLNLAEEALKYDVLFYIPLTEVSYSGGDTNRIQRPDEIAALGALWHKAIVPLQQQFPHILTLEGYPRYSQTEMVEAAYRAFTDFISAKQKAA